MFLCDIISITNKNLTRYVWQVIKNTVPNKIVYNNYVVINDYTCDVDYEGELSQWENI